MRQKIEKMSHKNEKWANITPETWVAMERKAQAAKAAKASQNKPKQAKTSKRKQKQAIEPARV